MKAFKEWYKWADHNYCPDECSASEGWIAALQWALTVIGEHDAQAAIEIIEAELGENL